VTAGAARPARRTGSLLGPAVAAALLASGCGGGARHGATPAPAHVSVRIASFQFMPAAIRVRADGTISFRDLDAEPHTATADHGGHFDTGTIKTGQTHSLRLTTPGTYTFYCLFHPFMRGRIEVVK
jgi:plastocyanin